jgi:TRAP-type mannitol/chloroaromatic compound transport system permease large subunit
MEVRYSAVRADVRALLAYNLRHSRRLQSAVIGIALAPATIVALLDALRGQFAVAALIPGLIIGVALAAFLLARAILRTKTDERWLAMDADGIRTTVGTIHGTVQWSQIDSAIPTADYIFITGKNMNGFAIPSRAFQAPSDRDAFLRELLRYRR